MCDDRGGASELRGRLGAHQGVEPPLEPLDLDRARAELRVLHHAQVEVTRRLHPLDRELDDRAGVEMARDLGYDAGLRAMAADPHYDRDWSAFVNDLRSQVGLVDFGDILFLRSEMYVKERRRKEPDYEPPLPPLAAVWGSSFRRCGFGTIFSWGRMITWCA